ncbi:MAG: hypothetical protein NTY38_06775, partial [Acidobacteria bacterium]|nr:hypothetical protein [Acidobacteriota bacterium]
MAILRRAAWLFGALAALVATCHGQEEEQAVRVRNYLEEEHSLSLAFETPHTRWAKPYAGGPVRVLFFSPWYQGATEPREIIELIQRFNRADWYGGDPRAGTKRALRLLDLPNAVLFVNELKLDVLPKEVREKLRRKVLDGTGLVLVGGGNVAPVFEGAPAKGRIAPLPSRAKLVYEPGWKTKFDYQMQEQGRTLLWAARREPKEGLRADVVADSRRARLAWTAMPRGTRLRVVLRRWDGEAHELKPVDAAGEGSASVALPAVREGGYHLDAIASQGGATRNWATTPFEVRAEQHVEAVTLEKDWAEAGEKIRGNVKLTGQVPADGVVRVRLLDKHGRSLAQQDLSSRDGSAPFEFGIQSWMPMLLRVEAVLREGTREVSSAYQFARVTQRHRGQFHFMMWNGPTGDLAPYGFESLARHGVSLVLQGGTPPLAMAENELSYVPYAASFRASSHTTTAMLDPKTGWLKSGCVYDQQKMRETLRQAVRYLQETYGEIGALNAEWNSRYGGFEEIELSKDEPLPSPDAPAWFREYFEDRQKLHLTDSEGASGDDLLRQVKFGDINDELGALERGNFPRWYDRPAFQNYTYVEWCKQFQQAFKGLDPQAWTGFEGTDSFAIRRFTTRSRQGGDLDLFVRQMDYFGPYNDPANEVVRSIAKPGFPRGNWMGYDPEVEKQLRQYWGQVTDGMNMVQWWRWDNLSGYHGFLAPDLSTFPATRELLEDTQVVRDGLGTLLMEAKMQDDGIAMLYSMPSTYIAHFDGNETFGDYKRDHDVWRGMLHGAGVQFRYVT